MEEKIRDIVARVAKKEDAGSLSIEADIFTDIGVQSTAALDLLLTIEEEFDVQISDDHFAEARSIKALATLVGSLQ